MKEFLYNIILTPAPRVRHLYVLKRGTKLPCPKCKKLLFFNRHNEAICCDRTYRRKMDIFRNKQIPVVSVSKDEDNQYYYDAIINKEVYIKNGIQYIRCPFCFKEHLFVITDEVYKTPCGIEMKIKYQEGDSPQQ